MLTTAGHRDVIEMREGLKPDRYNLRMTPPRAFGAAPVAARRAGARARGRLGRDPARPRVARDRAGRAGGGRGARRSRLLPARLAQSGTRAPGRRGGPGTAARCLRHHIGRGTAADQGVRAFLDDGRQCRGRSRHRCLSAAVADPAGGCRVCRAASGDAFAWRRRLGRRSRTAGGGHCLVRSGRRRGRGGRAVGSGRGARRHHLRHGRHQHRYRAGAGWRTHAVARPVRGRCAHRPAGAGYRDPGGRRRVDRQPGSLRPAARRARERRRAARSGVLRPGRHGRDRDRR